ncbi:hypothetical protein SLEP1_g42941 [Rubroshorea leprosula]|uniref:ENT domain-containing protein n=1 Tax=Rubroshorea leprosula TaxID=152421 RepID=A0AAV5LBU3_9ROSI|nr:hypothetical protein SLEP1_g42941 [Rubroshorea leprosula]
MEAQIHQLEQEAYCAVLRAFRAQFDAITWEKEGLITELRKELRVSDDEHRELLSKVNAVNLQSYVALSHQRTYDGMVRFQAYLIEAMELRSNPVMMLLFPVLEEGKDLQREHELALIDTLARLADASDGESGNCPFAVPLIVWSLVVRVEMGNPIGCPNMSTFCNMENSHPCMHKKMTDDEDGDKSWNGAIRDRVPTLNLSDEV